LVEQIPCAARYGLISSAVAASKCEVFGGGFAAVALLVFRACGICDGLAAGGVIA
jgi:hypothetical protein